MIRDPLTPKRHQFTNGVAGNLKYLSAFVTYQAEQLVASAKEVKALRCEVGALRAKLRESEGRSMMDKHKLFLSNRA